MKWLDSLQAYQRKQREFWTGVPASSMAILLAFAFCLFSSVGMLSRLSDPSPSLRLAWLLPLLSGGFAAGVVWASLRQRMSLGLALVAIFAGVQFGFGLYVKRHSMPGVPVPAELHRHLTTISVASVVLIGCAWGLALLFVNREGQRFFKVQTEMRLAGEIHKAVVPAIDRRVDNYEFYGVSLPTGTVGGDLVDVIARDGRWVAYIVDVSGHGVSSGVLMAMIKASIHTALRLHPQADGLLEVVNQVLCSLKATNMFATCALIAFSPQQGLRYVLAGHPPILHLRDEEIDLLSEGNLPLGVVPSAGFHGASCETRKGDVFALVTDGLTEIVGPDGEEHGFRCIAQALRKSGAGSAKEIARQILAVSSARDTKRDDQSILIVRCLA